MNPILAAGPAALIGFALGWLSAYLTERLQPPDGPRRHHHRRDGRCRVRRVRGPGAGPGRAPGRRAGPDRLGDVPLAARFHAVRPGSVPGRPGDAVHVLSNAPGPLLRLGIGRGLKLGAPHTTTRAWT